MKYLFLLGFLFLEAANAQTPDWNFSSADFKSGPIDIDDGQGNTFTTSMNNVGVRNSGRSAPLLIQASFSDYIFPEWPIKFGANSRVDITLAGLDAKCDASFSDTRLCRASEIYAYGERGLLPDQGRFVVSAVVYDDINGSNCLGEFTTIGGRVTLLNSGSGAWRFSTNAGCSAGELLLSCCPITPYGDL